MEPKGARRVEYSIWLGFHGEDVVPAELSATFQLSFDPRWAHVRGDPFEMDGTSHWRERGHVMLRGPRDLRGDFEAQAQYVLDRIEPRAGLLAGWIARGWIIRFSVLTVTNGCFGGPLVSAQTIRRVGNLGVPVFWKVPFATRDEEFDTHNADV